MDESLKIEYDSLRKEILDAAKDATQITIVLFGLLGAFYSFVFTKNDAKNIAFLVLIGILNLGIIVVFSQLVASKRRSIWRISTYIAVFIEPLFPKMGWETRVGGFQRDVFLNVDEKILMFHGDIKEVSSFGISNDQYLFAGAQLANCLVFVLYNAILASKSTNNQEFVLVIFLVIFTAVGIVFTTKTFDGLARRGVYHHDCIRYWLQIKKKERPS